MYLQRQQYLDWLGEMKDDPRVKIITGVKGIGKTVLLKESFYYYLISVGVRSDSILYIDVQQLAEKRKMNAQELSEYITTRLRYNLRYRIILDEPQFIPNYQTAIEPLKNAHDFYIVSSRFMEKNAIPNSVHIQMMPVSIAEYAACRKSTPKASIINYVTYGGYPSIIYVDDETTKAEKLSEIRTKTIQSEVYDAVNIRSKSLFRSILRHIIANRGDYLSAYSISEYMKSKGYETATDDTVQTYLDYLCNSYILQKIHRYDIKKETVLKTKNKYYLTDPVFGYVRGARVDKDAAYENMVCNELIRRGYDVYIGKNGDKEISFLAMNEEDKYYIQVAKNIPNKKVEEELLEPFKGLDDGYKKLVITLDDSESGRLMRGYRKLSFWDFLEADDSLDKA